MEPFHRNKNAYLAWMQGSFSLKHILMYLISGNLYLQTLYCLAWFQGSLSSKYILEALALCLPCECLRMCVCTSLLFFVCNRRVSGQSDEHAKYRLEVLCRSLSKCSDMLFLDLESC